MPRSGSTLLQNILGNHPDFYASPTSGLFDIINSGKEVYTKSPLVKAQDEKEMKKAFLTFCRYGLQGYYEGIDGLVDGLVESYQGKHGLLKNYKTFDMVDYKSNDQLLKYFKELLEIISDNRDSVKESYLQNQIDTIEELINSTLYKLKFLK
jgi:hypothetical protein